MLVLRRKCVDCMNDQIKKELLRLQDRKYRDFQVKLLPTVDPERTRGPGLSGAVQLLRASGGSGHRGTGLDGADQL